MDIHKKRFLISTHELVYGAPQALREYLEIKNAELILFISHPLQDSTGISYIEISDRNQRKILFQSSGNKFLILSYFFQLLKTVYWGLKYGNNYDIYIGVNPLNALAVIILKLLKKNRFVIYYTIDFSPIRFNSKILNYIYHFLDNFCVRCADEIWNVSRQIGEGRISLHGKKKHHKKQIIVPIGVWFNNVQRRPIHEINRYQILFVGNLLEKQGVQNIIQAIPRIALKIPEIKLIIIGGGEFENELKKLVNSIGIRQYVDFLGWVKDRNELDTIMSKSAIAVATYCSEISSYTKYADPTKIKDYLSAGLPIIMTNVSHNANELELRGCAVIVDENIQSIEMAVIELMRNEFKFINMRNSAVSFIKNYDWNIIFDNTFKKYEIT